MSGNLPRFEPLIKRYGYGIQHVLSKDAPAFSYTIGLPGKKLPELILIGFDPEIAQFVLNNVAQTFLKTGEALPGDLEGVIRNYPVRLRVCSSLATFYRYALTARRFADDRRITAPPIPMQVLLPDASGRFPDDPKSEYARKVPFL